jgi:hypothetical protein
MRRAMALASGRLALPAMSFGSFAAIDFSPQVRNVTDS